MKPHLGLPFFVFGRKLGHDLPELRNDHRDSGRVLNLRVPGQAYLVVLGPEIVCDLKIEIHRFPGREREIGREVGPVFKLVESRMLQKELFGRG